MDAYTKLKLKELRTQIDTCNYNDNYNLIQIIGNMYELLNDVIQKVNE